ncbi:MFS transporter [Brachybacterium sp. JB7]|uniref:MFS transporter n=1 Tax=Brachybacterium TaxID=43668 RepID=UPI000BB7F9AE|nr:MULTISPECIES: MFS transporter [Brachybacterium]PCC35866.1 MFS transporter [Brachybacterium alimentarium]RCS63446.1 MFS transporter [Brachybacterium sp. JB7]
MGRNTWVYLGSYSLSLLGNGIASVLFPLLVLAKTGDILAAGILASVTAAVAAVVGVLAGVVVDRVNRRTVSITSDVLSAGSVAALPVVDAVWGLNLTWFIVLGVIGAFGDMPGMTARETMLPRLVQLDGGKPGALDRLVGVRESLSAALMLIGPGVGGLLVFLLGVSSTTLFITAGTSLAAAALSLALSSRAGAIEPIAGAAEHSGSPGVRGVATDLVQGWRFLLGHRLVLGASILTAVFVAVIAGLQATILPAYFLQERLPEFSGFAVTGIALGSLFGAGLYAATVGKASRRAWFVIGMLGSVIGFAALGAMGAPWLVIAAAVLIGLTNAPMSAVLGVATIEATPDRMRGRVLGAQNALMLAAPALTAAPIAAIASGYGLTTAGVGIAVVMAVTAVIALIVPAFRSLDTIETPDSETPEPGEQEG